MQNSLAPGAEKKPTFSAAVTGNSLQNLIKKSVPDARSAARFTGTLVSVVAQNENLQRCDPATIVAAALRGEGMGLNLGSGYYLVPFGQSCTYMLGYKGLIQLALSGGDVADIDVVEVREGEIVGRDKRTKRLTFDFSVYQDEAEMMNHPVIGYYAYVELKSGYFRYEYMSIADILSHASRYSKSFNIDTYSKLQSGAFSAEQAERIRSTSPWYSSTETMMKKTVMRRLLNSGFVPLANSAKLREELSEDIQAESGDLINLDLGGNVKVVETTGEVVEDTETPSEAPEVPSAVSDDKVHIDTPKKPVGRPRKNDSTIPVDTPEQKPDMGDDYDQSFRQHFFGGNQ